MCDKDKERLFRRLRREGHNTSLFDRQAIVAKVVASGDYCVICRQDAGHRRVWGYGDRESHPNLVAFGSIFDITEYKGQLTFNSPPRRIARLPQKSI